MNEGILGQIANPQLADVAGAMQYRKSRMDEDEAKRKELRMNQLIAQAIPNMKDGSPIKEMFQTDPQKAAMVSKMLGIPLNDGEAWEKFRGQTRELASLAETDPKLAVERARQMQADNQRNGVQDANLDKWLAPMDAAMNNQDPAQAEASHHAIITQFNALGMMDKNINSDYHTARDAQKQKADLAERGMKVDERQVAAQEVAAR